MEFVHFMNANSQSSSILYEIWFIVCLLSMDLSSGSLVKYFWAAQIWGSELLLTVQRKVYRYPLRGECTLVFHIFSWVAVSLKALNLSVENSRIPLLVSRFITNSQLARGWVIQKSIALFFKTNLGTASKRKKNMGKGRKPNLIGAFVSAKCWLVGLMHRKCNLIALMKSGYGNRLFLSVSWNCIACQTS